jgi:hypothetical protein
MTTTAELDREDLALLKTIRAQTRRKLVAEDLTETGEEGQTLYDLAESWLPSQTEAEFEWLADLATKYVRGGELTDRQAAGVLNCLYAELTRDGRGTGNGARQQRVPVDKTHPVPGGYYTVVLGPKQHRTLRLSDWVDDKRKPGAQVRWLSLLVGPDNTQDYTTAALQRDDGSLMYMRDFNEDGPLRQAVGVLLDPDGTHTREMAREAYAMASGRCANCNRQLTVPASLHRGLGPECAAKLGLAADEDEEEGYDPNDYDPETGEYLGEVPF